MGILKVTTTRLGKSTDRFTMKEICKNGTDIGVNYCNTSKSAQFTSKLKSNDNEIKTICVELSETTLINALTCIENIGFSPVKPPLNQHCNAKIKDDVQKLEMYIGSPCIKDYHAMMEIIKSVSHYDFDKYTKALKQLSFERYETMFIVTWSRLYS